MKTALELIEGLAKGLTEGLTVGMALGLAVRQAEGTGSWDGMELAVGTGNSSVESFCTKCKKVLHLVVSSHLVVSPHLVLSSHPVFSSAPDRFALHSEPLDPSAFAMTELPLARDSDRVEPSGNVTRSGSVRSCTCVQNV